MSVLRERKRVEGVAGGFGERGIFVRQTGWRGLRF